jgi:c-di-GMP-related signal transduction protein
MNVFVARQPIFDKERKVVAYELLFRSGKSEGYDNDDGDQATTDVIVNSFLSIGIDVVTGGKKAFINFTGNLLKNKVAQLLPCEVLAVEILETVEPEEDIVKACKELKRKGYTLVLDDFVFDSRFQPLIELADIIKIDFLLTKERERNDIVRRFSATKIKFLAEKVETEIEFQEAVSAGYSLFQGYFFSKPVVITRSNIPASKLSYLKLLQEIKFSDMNTEHIEQIIKREISFSYRLLKYINSSAFGLRQEIRSIKQAISLLGQRELLKWVSLNALCCMDESKPPELIITALVRGYFLELLASRIGKKQIAPDVFLMGLFSLIDALLDCPLVVILDELPVGQEVKSALLGQDGLFRDIYQLAVSYERADWLAVALYAKKMGLPEQDLPELYLQALTWSREFSNV